MASTTDSAPSSITHSDCVQCRSLRRDASQLATGRGEALESILDLNGVRVIHGEWWRLLTSAFVQVELPHLISRIRGCTRLPI